VPPRVPPFVVQVSAVACTLLGGWFVSDRAIPKRAVIRLRQDGRGVRVEASIEEALGVGYLDPIFRRKYLRSFESWDEWSQNHPLITAPTY
jgi:hypothetical protein